MTSTLGLLLAAGAGRRMGMPKALVEGTDGLPWAVSSVRTLIAGGCSDVVAVIGAQAGDVRALLSDEPATIVEATDWDDGMGSSLRAGLAAIAGSDADAMLLHLVDLPDVGSDVIARLLTHARDDVLARAAYGNGPGHPVLIGRDHWQPIAQEAHGDVGARAYLARHNVTEVDCSDLAVGIDIDDPRHMLGS